MIKVALILTLMFSSPIKETSTHSMFNIDDQVVIYNKLENKFYDLRGREVKW